MFENDKWYIKVVLGIYYFKYIYVYILKFSLYIKEK